MYSHDVDALRGQKRVLDPVEAFVSCQTWVLEANLCFLQESEVLLNAEPSLWPKLAFKDSASLFYSSCLSIHLSAPVSGVIGLIVMFHHVRLWQRYCSFKLISLQF